MEVKSDTVKSNIAQEPGMLGPGIKVKLDVVKQKMSRVNINILGISELKWIGMGKFNSEVYYIYYYGQETLRRNGVTLIVNKSPKYSTWVQSPKGQNDLCLFPKQTIQYYSNPSL